MVHHTSTKPFFALAKPTAGPSEYGAIEEDGDGHGPHQPVERELTVATLKKAGWELTTTAAELSNTGYGHA
jgi:hypothetical protein